MKSRRTWATPRCDACQWSLLQREPAAVPRPASVHCDHDIPGRFTTLDHLVRRGDVVQRQPGRDVVLQGTAGEQPGQRRYGFCAILRRKVVDDEEPERDV